MQSVLDEVDPTKPKPGRQSLRQSILGGVPEHVDPDSFESFEDDGDKEKKSELPLHHQMTTQNEKDKTRAQELWELTNDMKKMQGSLGAVADSVASMKGEGQSDADALLNYATKIVDRHHSSFVNNKDPHDELEASTGSFESNDDDVNEAGNLSPSQSVSKIPKKRRTAQVTMKASYEDFEEWIKFKKMNAWTFVRTALFFIMVPATAVAAVLYYLAGNPPCPNGICNSIKLDSTNVTALVTLASASSSWWILFIFVRQLVTFTLSTVTSALLVE